MALSYTKPTINTTPPEPPINKAEADRIRAANDAKVQAIADGVDDIVTGFSNKVLSEITQDDIADGSTYARATTAGATFANAVGADSNAGTEAWATVTSNGTNVNVQATGTVTGVSDAPADGSSVTVGNKTYTFKTSLTPTEGEVLIGANLASALTNLVAAVMHTGTPDTDYKCAAAHTQVTAAVTTPTTVVTFTSILRGTVGNAYALTASTDPASNLTASGAALGSGADHTITVNGKAYTFVGDAPNAEGEVLVGADAAETLDNLKLAINRTDPTTNDGVKYKVAAAHTTVQATTNTDTVQTLEALAVGYAGNAYTLATTATTYTLSGPYFFGGEYKEAAQMFSRMSPMVKFTPEGGLAIKLTNKTGAATVKGTIVNVYTASAVDNAFALCAAETLDCIGAVYEAGVADGSAAWVVVSGIAQVLFKAATTRGQVARTPVNADSGEAAGYAMPMTVPANPNVLTEDHFREIGHILESKDADTLCKIVMHFN